MAIPPSTQIQTWLPPPAAAAPVASSVRAAPETRNDAAGAVAPAAARVSRPEPRQGREPWNAAADAGVAIAGGAEKAAVKTAGVFARLGRSIGRSF
jgi:hypothetical protein